MGYRRLEIELSQPLERVTLSSQETGVGLIARYDDRLVGFAMLAAEPGSTISATEMARIADERFADAVLRTRTAAALAERWPSRVQAELPTLSVAICTKDRAARLSRLLRSLTAACERSPFRETEIVVVDNAPSDETTREAVEAFAGVRYVREPKAGLDFARNAALAAATGDLLAFLDDDVVVDRGWLSGLFEASRDAPGAGGFTGLVLPFRLDTDAQVAFERRGGFGRGFTPTEFGQARFGNALHPVGAGVLGAGCNMCFDRALLLEIGGFDDALDTGRPLPGGGDLDIFYRVMRTGRPMVYAPAYAVYHEHRETLDQLQHQYFTWGLGFMAFLTKSRRTDPGLRARQDGIVRWWFLDRLTALARASAKGRRRELGFTWAELWGGLVGMAGEYDRSCERVRRIREAS